MAWSSWADFMAMFSEFKLERLDIIEGADFDTNSDKDLIYPKIGQFAHPVIKFTAKGKTKRKKKKAKKKTMLEASDLPY